MTATVDVLLPVEDWQIAASVFVPAQVQDGPQPVVFLFPGGGLNRVYFDLPLDGGYSQARWLAAQGFVVVTVDHLGSGDSTIPEADPAGTLSGGRLVTVARLDAERAADLAVRAVLDGLRAGSFAGVPVVADPVPIGSGHSLGGHVVVGMQAAYETFAGIAPYGSAISWTRMALAPGRRQPFRAAPDADHKAAAFFTDWPTNDYWDDVPAEVVAADRQRDPVPTWRRTHIPSFGGELLEAFASARQAATVRVPVLLLYGEQDVTNEPLEDLALFRSAPSVSLTVVPRMGHGHNFATTREIAWMKLAGFVREVMALREIGYP